MIQTVKEIKMHWTFLNIAIIGEIFATTFLKMSEGFSKPLFAILSLLSYGVAFYFLSVVLKTITVGVAYALWAGIGIAAMAIIGAVLFNQQLDWAAILGIALIIAGVVILNTLSKSVSH